MSLTLARLCGEWRLVSKIYGARSGKYEARIAIFHIFAAIYRFSQISWKVESRQRNRKAVEEDFLGFLGNWKAAHGTKATGGATYISPLLTKCQNKYK